MSKKRRWQFRTISWFWVVLVIAAFFFGRNWDATRDALWPSAQVTTAKSGANVGAPVAVDVCTPIASSPGSEESNFSFFLGVGRAHGTGSGFHDEVDSPR
jgi:hypothetical protein